MDEDKVVTGVFDTEEAWVAYMLRGDKLDADAAVASVETREDLVRFLRLLAVAVERGIVELEYSRGLLFGLCLITDPDSTWGPFGEDPDNYTVPDRLSWREIANVFWWGIIRS